MPLREISHYIWAPVSSKGQWKSNIQPPNHTEGNSCIKINIKTQLESKTHTWQLSSKLRISDYIPHSSVMKRESNLQFRKWQQVGWYCPVANVNGCEYSCQLLFQFLPVSQLNIIMCYHGQPIILHERKPNIWKENRIHLDLANQNG